MTDKKIPALRKGQFEKERTTLWPLKARTVLHSVSLHGQGSHSCGKGNNNSRGECRIRDETYQMPKELQEKSIGKPSMASIVHEGVKRLEEASMKWSDELEVEKPLRKGEN